MVPTYVPAASPKGHTMLITHGGLTTHDYSRFTIDDSPLTTHPSRSGPFGKLRDRLGDDSRLTTHDSPLTIHPLPSPSN